MLGEQLDLLRPQRMSTSILRERDVEEAHLAGGMLQFTKFGNKKATLLLATMTGLTAGAPLVLFSRPPKTLSAFTLEATHRHRSVISA